MTMSSGQRSARKIPTADQHVREDLPEPARRCSVARVRSPVHLPDDRARDPPAVERERRDQVEQQQDDVDAWRGRRASPERRPTGPSARSARRPRSRPPPATSTPSRQQTIAISSVTSGPGDRDPELDAGRVVSRDIFAIPPNSHRSMPAIAIPLRIATTAWPSSCSRIERKKSSALTVASANAPLSSLPGDARPGSSRSATR